MYDVIRKRLMKLAKQQIMLQWHQAFEARGQPEFRGLVLIGPDSFAHQTAVHLRGTSSTVALVKKFTSGCSAADEGSRKEVNGADSQSPPP